MAMIDLPDAFSDFRAWRWNRQSTSGGLCPHQRTEKPRHRRGFFTGSKNSQYIAIFYGFSSPVRESARKRSLAAPLLAAMLATMLTTMLATLARLLAALLAGLARALRLLLLAGLLVRVVLLLVRH
jgi:hypothetical protein